MSRPRREGGMPDSAFGIKVGQAAIEPCSPEHEDRAAVQTCLDALARTPRRRAT
ncbi:MAG TPA: hypothetical protein VFQ20_09980 [Burkholderiaceae bacterium]|nr:hypothetical protein [Burkholderiaceae bacterium]